MTKIITVLAVASLTLVAPVLAHCGACGAGDDHEHSNTIVDAAAGNDDFSTLVKAVKAAGLADALTGEGPFTVFAPNNAAFEKLPEGALEDLLEDADSLAAVLKYHVIPGRILSTDLSEDTAAASLLGQNVDIAVGDHIKVDGAKVITADIEVDNGVIHVIDGVIMPNLKNVVETAAKADEFSTLVKAVEAADLAEALSGEGPFTIFAPANAAFDKLPEGALEALLDDPKALASVLKLHVVPGRHMAADVAEMDQAETLLGHYLEIEADEHVMVGGAKVIATDIEAMNGVIHVIDTVILPE